MNYTQVALATIIFANMLLKITLLINVSDIIASKEDCHMLVFRLTSIEQFLSDHGLFPQSITETIVYDGLD